MADDSGVTKIDWQRWYPRRAVSWWTTINELQWPNRSVRDDIRRRADALAEAGVDLAINFGCHMRFDFAMVFGSLHGYLGEVADELHRVGIRFFDHYSSNVITRPRGAAGRAHAHRSNRHQVLFYPDPIAAPHQQYAGHRYDDLRTIDLRDGGAAYATPYDSEQFCSNHPDYLDMHRQYLVRLFDEVDLDGIEVDDMADYGGLASCGCRFCLDRFRSEYGLELPPLSDAEFWGDTSGHPYLWGNYAHPDFQSWITMREQTMADHLALVKRTIGDRPLMTCCASTGPMNLGGRALNLERLLPHVDLLMLENVGLAPDGVNWLRLEAEAMQQKDLARQRGDVPVLALTYMLGHDGGLLGWALSRFWGTSSWASTNPGRLEVDPAEPLDEAQITGPVNRWEQAVSPLDSLAPGDVVDVRLLNDTYARAAGWRDADGREEWDRVKDWTYALVEHQVGYRLIRPAELEAGPDDDTPLVLDGAACVSDALDAAVRALLDRGGRVWVRGPYGTHHADGKPRARSLLDDLVAVGSPGLRVLAEPVATGRPAPADRTDQPPLHIEEDRPRHDPVRDLLDRGELEPTVTVSPADAGWALRLRRHAEGFALHVLNLRMHGEAHPTLLEMGERPVLETISSVNPTTSVTVTLRGPDPGWRAPQLFSPELGRAGRPVRRDGEGFVLDLTGVSVYAVVHDQLGEG